MLKKYPKTFHLPWSTKSSITNDDKILKNCDQFIGMNVVVTIKMDGENTSLYPNYYHARSLDSSHHESQSWLKQFHSTFKNDIPEGYRICGENVFAFHSIFYNDLKSYFYGFSIWDPENYCLSWKETLEWFELFNITPVEILYEGIWNEDLIKNLDYKNQEGYVVRNADRFHYSDFKTNVAKCVRPNHVQTDKHWKEKSVVPNRLGTSTEGL